MIDTRSIPVVEPEGNIGTFTGNGFFFPKPGSRSFLKDPRRVPRKPLRRGNSKKNKKS